MKIEKFNESKRKFYNTYKIFASVNENQEPIEYSGIYHSYKEALNTIIDWIDNGVRNKEIYDAFIVKISREKLNNDEIKARIASKKYNL